MFLNFILFIYCLVYLPYLLFTGRWYKDYHYRFGFLPSSLRQKLAFQSSIWIHAVSVGEILVVANLLDQIKEKSPLTNIIITVTTKTGYHLAQSKFQGKAIILPSPVDFSWVARRFISIINPKVYIVAETEIWPNLFKSLSVINVPIIIINGRISDGSYKRYGWVRNYLKRVLSYVAYFCVQSDTDLKRLQGLGVANDKMLNVGNIKFDTVIEKGEDSVLSSIFDKRPVWIAGSTHPGEEEIILKAFVVYKSQWGLVIAPRHVERCGQLADLIKSYGFKVAMFSELKSGKLDQETIVLIDKIGYLRNLYAHASLVFVGKSLCGRGGQNIIEPASYGKAIMVGPHMQNFRDIVNIFNAKGSIVQVKDVHEFKFQVDRLIKDASYRRSLGQKAQSVVQDNQGATQRTIQIIEKYL